MKTVSLVFALAALATGLWAAWKWYRSSQVTPNPGWDFEPVIESHKRLGWDVAMPNAFSDAGKLNANAAGWTAASVALGTVSNVLGYFA
jgi:hypothetical protein